MKPSRRACLGVIAAVAGLSVKLQLALSIERAIHAGEPAMAGVLETLSYFTTLANTLLAAVSVVAALRPSSRFARPTMLSAVAVYIAVVGLVYHVALSALWRPSGLQLVAALALHYATPLLYLGFWLAFERQGALRWRDPLSWLIFPLLYFAYAMLRGGVTGWYPYPFIDAGKLGYGAVLANAAGLLFAFLALGLILVAVDRLLSRAGPR